MVFIAYKKPFCEWRSYALLWRAVTLLTYLRLQWQKYRPAAGTCGWRGAKNAYKGKSNVPKGTGRGKKLATKSAWFVCGFFSTSFQQLAERSWVCCRVASVRFILSFACVCLCAYEGRKLTALLAGRAHGYRCMIHEFVLLASAASSGFALVWLDLAVDSGSAGHRLILLSSWS